MTNSKGFFAQTEELGGWLHTICEEIRASLKVACKIIRKSYKFGKNPEESLNKLPIEEIDEIFR